MIEERKSDSLLVQFYATTIANLVILSHGATIGWLSPALPVLMSDESPLSSGPITNEQLSNIGSINSIGSIFGTFLCGLISVWVGPKRAMIFLAFPHIAFWVLVYFGTTYYHILVARFLFGISGGGIHAGVTLYVSEIANDNARGRLLSVTTLSRTVGVLIAFFGGAFIKYEYRPFIFVFIPIIYLIGILSLPNTPLFFLKKDDIQSAEKSLMYYKGCKGATDREQMLLKTELERLKKVDEARQNSPKLQMNDFCNRMALKGVIMSIAASWFSQATGCYLLTNYASLIFEKSGTALGTNTSSIILAVVQILAGLVSTQLGDTFGRKTILFVSLAGSSVGLFIFSGYLYLRHNGYDVSNFLWLPEVCLSLVIFISSAGAMALATTCAVENFPTKIRTAGMSFYSLANNGVTYTGDKFLPILTEVIYLHGFMFVLGINCCIGMVLVIFMKETKGSSLDTIDSDDKKNNEN